jgi:hypothetical protein
VNANAGEASYTERFIIVSQKTLKLKIQNTAIKFASRSPFAVVVNQASCCGCPVAASDRVGATTTGLIAPVNPDFVFPFDYVPVLTELLRRDAFRSN